MNLSDFTTLTFDVFGTLIDWESGMISGLRPLTDKLDSELSRDAILEAHAFHESTAQAQVPNMLYARVLAVVYKRLAEEWGVSASWEECHTYGQSVADWPAFPDSVDALAYLKQHYDLVVLSNVDNATFAAPNKRLGEPFHAVYTAEDVGSYKPSPRNFQYMLTMLGRRGIEHDKILHTAESLFHDHVPAKAAGLANCWIYRRHDQKGFGATRDPGEMPQIDMRFTSMAEMAEAHRMGNG